MQNDVYEQKSYIPLDDELDYTSISGKVEELINQDLYSYFVGRKNSNIVIKTVTSAIVEFKLI